MVSDRGRYRLWNLGSWYCLLRGCLLFRLGCVEE